MVVKQRICANTLVERCQEMRLDRELRPFTRIAIVALEWHRLMGVAESQPARQGKWISLGNCADNKP